MGFMFWYSKRKKDDVRYTTQMQFCYIYSIWLGFLLFSVLAKISPLIFSSAQSVIQTPHITMFLVPSDGYWVAQCLSLLGALVFVPSVRFSKSIAKIAQPSVFILSSTRVRSTTASQPEPLRPVRQKSPQRTEG